MYFGIFLQYVIQNPPLLLLLVFKTTRFLLFLLQNKKILNLSRVPTTKYIQGISSIEKATHTTFPKKLAMKLKYLAFFRKCIVGCIFTRGLIITREIPCISTNKAKT
jgi:hypothetical protein